MKKLLVLSLLASATLATAAFADEGSTTTQASADPQTFAATNPTTSPTDPTQAADAIQQPIQNTTSDAVTSAPADTSANNG